MTVVGAKQLLRIEDLSVTIHGRGGQVAALSNVHLHVSPGEVVGLVGESGGGKSMIARSIVGLLPEGAHATGHVWFDAPDGGDRRSGGRDGMVDVLRLDPRGLQAHRGGGAALCFQNPRGALSPTRSVGRQMTDRLLTHQVLSGQQARETAHDLFAQVGIRNPSDRLRAYPHELSGGMAQRVMISLATACAPGLLVADEPTTGLDVTLARDILAQFRQAADRDGRGVLLISHDLASVAQVCDRVVVLYAGTVVESGPTRQVLRDPAHPYTRALLASVPGVDGRPVSATAGRMPSLSEPPGECPFAPRCAHATDECREQRPLLSSHGAGWQLACFHPQSGPVQPPPSPVAVTEPDGYDGEPAAAPVLEIADARVVYKSRFGSGGHQALRGVSLQVRAGETVGVVGESGCGKSTLAKLIVGLVEPASGTVTLDGIDVASAPRGERRRLRTRAQMVYQDPIGSLSPRRTVADAVGEPLRALGVPAREREERVAATVQRMGLDESVLGRYPHQLSGGQAQRVGIARALIGEARVIVFDEPTSALDVTVQAQILEVIREVTSPAVSRAESRGAVFISHDLATVRGFCDRVVVLYLGQVVEEGPVDEVFTNPRHPYTRALLASAPSLTEGFAGTPVHLLKDIDEADVHAGCPLAPRCPFVAERCRTEPQELRPYGANRAACWQVPRLLELWEGERTRV